MDRNGGRGWKGDLSCSLEVRPEAVPQKGTFGFSMKMMIRSQRCKVRGQVHEATGLSRLRELVGCQWAPLLQQVHIKAVLAALVQEPQPEPPEHLLPSRWISQ